jgi:hypothetical protein
MVDVTTLPQSTILHDGEPIGSPENFLRRPNGVSYDDWASLRKMIGVHCGAYVEPMARTVKIGLPERASARRAR